MKVPRIPSFRVPYREVLEGQAGLVCQIQIQRLHTWRNRLVRLLVLPFLPLDLGWLNRGSLDGPELIFFVDIRFGNFKCSQSIQLGFFGVALHFINSNDLHQFSNFQYAAFLNEQFYTKKAITKSLTWSSLTGQPGIPISPAGPGKPGGPGRPLFPLSFMENFTKLKRLFRKWAFVTSASRLAFHALKRLKRAQISTNF